MPDDRKIWDEFQWEEFMKEQDKKVDRYTELFFRYQHDPDRDAIIAKEMGWYWLLENDEEKEADSEEDAEEIEEGEEWKSALNVGDKEEIDLHSYKQLPVFQRSHEFAMRVLEVVEQLPEAKRNESIVVDFISNAMIASAKLAGGSGLGNSIEELGGNIAYCKRGLAAANVAIASLYEMNERGIVGHQLYLELIEDAVEVRNAIAIYVLELREQFKRGIS